MAADWLRKSGEVAVDVRFAIHRCIQRLPHAFVGEWPTGVVQRNHDLSSRLTLDDRESRILLETGDLIGCANLRNRVDVASFERVVDRVCITDEAKLHFI